ncbi:MAG: DEDD exonuclease domain-containing protein [Acidimicrobiia bacterium]|nr:DEDD exonuclease domain-containing protein [Acidimicrobiia bacterium]
MPSVQRSFEDLGVALCDVTFCVLDLETTGGDRTADRITEVGAVKVRGGEFLGTFQTLVAPGRAIPPRITMLTGLTDALVAPAPAIGAVLPSLLEFIGDAVVVGHNVGFDMAFIRRALSDAGRSPLDATVVDTMPLARRLLRDEVPNHKLSTLASRLRLDHAPSHRALDDALATTDLLHVLIERAAGLGVLGLDDLLALSSLAGHPQAAKLKMTDRLPRSPGVYLFRGDRDEVLYVGKATNLRQRVRSYFGSDDRRKVGAMLRETQAIDHMPLPDPLTAEIIEQRLIARLLPRYNRKGTRVDKYCYVRLDTDTAWPRLSIVKRPSKTGEHLGPLPSRRMAQQVVDALQTAFPLRRCSTRLGRAYRPRPDAAPCSAAQIGVAHCPCAGDVEPDRYRSVVESTRAAMRGHHDLVVECLRGRMTQQAAQQRFEEASLTRDRLSAWMSAARRRELVDALVRAERVEIRWGDSTWLVEGGRLLDATRSGEVGRDLAVPPPDALAAGRAVPATQVDESLCLARFCEARADQLEITCSGRWDFPLPPATALSRLDQPSPDAIDRERLGVPARR